MKKISPPHILILLITIFSIGYLFWGEPPKNIYNKGNYIDLIEMPDGISTIEKINAKNKKIRTFTCNDIKIEAYNKIRINLHGKLFYEKDRNFKMTINSLLFKEVILGSNDNYFWFWSKRMNPPVLHYAKYEDLYKTRLKTPFHPLWIMECLGLDEISTKNIAIQKGNKYWKIYEPRMSAMNKVIRKVTVIDPKKLLILGHYIYEDEELVASSETRQFENINNFETPKKIVIIWHKENMSMVWNLNNSQTNTNLDPSLWKIPNHNRKINMGID